MTEARNSPFKAVPQTLRYDKLEQPDNQIRLLTLGYDADRQKVSGELKVVSLDEHPVYDAISYVWGDLHNLSQIMVNGEQFNVTRNQEECLQSLQIKGISTVWIDGVCIDQQNLLERSAQVMNMKRVFQLANEVHVWISPELDYPSIHKVHDEVVMKALEEAWRSVLWDDILKHMPSTPRNAGDEISELGPDDLCNELLQMINLMEAKTPLKKMPFYHIHPSNCQPLLRKSWYLALFVFYEIYSSNWWERVWILQEVLFCKNEPQLHLGSISLPLNRVLHACRYFENQSYYLDEPSRLSEPRATRKLRKVIFPIISMMRETAHLYQGTTIMEIRAGFKKRNMTGLPPDVAFGLALERKVSDARDFIYGTLGLLDDRFKSIIYPDYRDEDVSSLFVKASRYVVQSSRGALQLDLSRGAVEPRLKTGHFEYIDENEPTWGLEWGFEETGHLWRPRKGGRANGSTKHATSADDISLRHLTVIGSTVGVVTEIGLRGSDRWGNYGWDGKSELDIINSWRLLAGLDDHDMSQRPSEVDERLEDRFWRVLTDGQPADDSIAGKYHWASWQPQPASGSSKPWEQRINGSNLKFKWTLLKDDLAKDHADKAQLSVTELEKSAKISIHCHTQHKVLFRFRPDQEAPFTNSDPPMGTGRRTTQVGDILAILKGCQWPVVLRATQRAGMWKWVGPAHVDELMDGQWVTPNTRWASFTLV